jgi:hypothetical protein
MSTDLGALDTVLMLMMSDGLPVLVGSPGHRSSVVEPLHRPLRRVGALVFNRLGGDIAGGITDTQWGSKRFSGPLARTLAAEPEASARRLPGACSAPSGPEVAGSVAVSAADAGEDPWAG